TPASATTSEPTRALVRCIAAECTPGLQVSHRGDARRSYVRCKGATAKEGMMRQRKLRDLEVSAIGLGCMGMSAFYGSTDEDEAARQTRPALDLGVTSIDTAQLQGPPTNELRGGRPIRGPRDGYVIATKFYRRMDVATPGDMTTVGPQDGSPEHVRASIEGSLER